MGRLWQLVGELAGSVFSSNMLSCTAEPTEDQIIAQVLKQMRFHQLHISWRFRRYFQLARLVVDIGFSEAEVQGQTPAK